MRKILTIGRKDLQLVVRDRPALMTLLGMPVVLILILSMALGNVGKGESNPLPVAVVDHDGTDISRQIADALVDRDKLGSLLKAERTSNAEAARRKVRMGDLMAMVEVPKGFGAKLDSGKQGVLRVETDPGQPLAAGIFRSVVEALSQRVSAAAVAAQTTSRVMAESRFVTSEAEAHRYVLAAVDDVVADKLDTVAITQQGRPTGRGMDFNALDYYGAGMAVMFLNFGAMFGAFALLRERTEETLGRLLSAPISRVQVLAGKALGIFAVGTMQFLVLFAFTRLVGAHWGESAGVMLVAGAQVAAATGLALALAGFGKTQRAAGAIGPIVILLMAAAGGSWMPVSQMPEAVRPIHLLSINGWSLDAMLRLQSGAGVASVLPNAAALLGIGVALSALGVWRLKWER